MKILLAPDKFKGTLTAIEVAESIRKGLEEGIAGLETFLSPIADGGEGTLDIILKAARGKIIFSKVVSPYGETVEAGFGILPEKSGESLTAIIEMAQASGLSLVKGIKKPLKASTFGTGQLIRIALDKGCREIFITVGGSATSDAGIGALQALGIKFLNKKFKPLGLGARQLLSINHIDQSQLYEKVKLAEFKIAVDVDNPFYGANGAVNTYAKQKGANFIQRQQLEKGFRNFAELILKNKNIDLQKIPGSGAAGGLAGGLLAFLPHVSIVNGFDIVSELTNFKNKIKSCDYVVTGEGCIDGQTVHGKAPCGVAKLVKKYSKKAIAIAGKLGTDWQKNLNYFEAIYTLTGQRGILRNGKPKIEVPFNHKIALMLKRPDISERYALKNSSFLLEKLSPIFLKDFLKKVNK